MPYLTQLSLQHATFLSDLFGENVSFDPIALRVYETDASLLRGKALAMVSPKTVEEVQKFMCFAQAHNIPVHPRGRGTSLSGGSIPTVPGIVLSLLAMDKIISVCTKDFIAEVEPGVCTATLQAACEEKNLFYPPDPASSKATSIGGNVATAAGGLRAVKYGITRDYVLGCETVLADGTLIKLGGKNHKDVMGLDLCRLMVGSEGTLGIITKLCLKLLPLPRATASILAGFHSLDDAFVAMDKVFQSGLLPAAVEFMNEMTLEVLKKNESVPWPHHVKSLMLFQVDGTEEETACQISLLKHTLQGAAWLLIGEGVEEKNLWYHRRRISSAAYTLGPARFGGDMAVPRGSLLPAIREFEKIANRHGKPLIAFGHAGDGNIHSNIHYDPSSANDVKRALQIKTGLDEAVIQFHGSISGEHGAGCTKLIEKQINPTELELMRKVRKLFDPCAILNPQKGY